MLMGIRIQKVVYLEAQKEVTLFPHSKGVRMDVYLEGDGEIYNIEMQTARRTNLVKRMRYYHSAIDVDSLESCEADALLPLRHRRRLAAAGQSV